MNAEEVKSARAAAWKESQSNNCGGLLESPSQTGPQPRLSLLLLPPCSPHWLPPRVTASGEPRHHFNPCVAAPGTEAAPWGCAEGGGRAGKEERTPPLPKLGCGDLQAPRGAGPGGLGQNEEQVSLNLFQFAGKSPCCSPD